MGSICLLSDGGLPSVSCVTHYSFVRSFVRSQQVPAARSARRINAHNSSARLRPGNGVRPQLLRARTDDAALHRGVSRAGEERDRGARLSRLAGGASVRAT